MEVEKQVGSGPETKMVGNIPYTPRVKKVLALAGKEAKALQHSYVGTEHILLGLLREGEGVAARVLKSLEVDIERTRNEILKELDPNFAPQEEGEALAMADELMHVAKNGGRNRVMCRDYRDPRQTSAACGAGLRTQRASSAAASAALL